MKAEKVVALIVVILAVIGFFSGLSVIVDLADASARAPSAVPRGVFVFSEERIPIINRETGATEQKILLQYAIDGATFYAELDDDEELARYYEYLRDLRRR
mgnify:CR=1 FL=1